MSKFILLILALSLSSLSLASGVCATGYHEEEKLYRTWFGSIPTNVLVCVKDEIK